jgi:hypothetical protein
MSIVLLSLSNWTESHITAIYQATSQSDTSNALDNFLSKDAVITVNGKAISRADLTKQLQAEKFLEAGAIVTFLGIVEVPTDQTAPVEVIGLHFLQIWKKKLMILMAVIQAGSVGTFYTVTIQETIRVRDAPVSSKVTASLNVVYVCDLKYVSLTD